MNHHRPALALPFPFRQNSAIKYRRINWSRADWTLTDAEIALRLVVEPDAVYKHRKRHGIPPSPIKFSKLWPPKPRFDWDAVDWTWTNARIAHALGCSITAVWYRRRARGAPYRPGQRQSLPPAKPRFAWGKVDWKWTDARIAKKLGCTVGAVRVQRLKRAEP